MVTERVKNSGAENRSVHPIFTSIFWSHNSNPEYCLLAGRYQVRKSAQHILAEKFSYLWGDSDGEDRRRVTGGLIYTTVHHKRGQDPVLFLWTG